MPLDLITYVHVQSCSSLCKCALFASASEAKQQKLQSCLHILDVGRKSGVLASGPGAAGIVCPLIVSALLWFLLK